MSNHNPGHDEAAALFRSYIEQGKGVESTMELYNETADKYDEFLKTLGARSQERLAQAVKELMSGNPDARILDVCAGTGLSGEALYNAGFRNIDAHDGSKAMLDIAVKKGVYQNLFCEMIGDKDLNISKYSYDVATLCGGFHENHLRTSAFRYIIPLVKPGGYIVNTMRETVVNAPWYGDGLEVFMAQLEAEGLWRKVRHQVFPDYTGSGTGCMSGVIHIYQVL